MKLVILGDTHFGGGYSLGTINSYRQLNSRLIDFSNTFDHVVDFMKSNGVKHFVITGDIFESRRPQASELGLFSEKLQRLSELGIHTHIVIGNHDTICEQSATTIDVLDKLKLPMVHIYSDIAVTLCLDGDEAINLIFFPFRNRQMLDCATNNLAVRRLSERLEYEIDRMSDDPKILVGHLMIQNTILGNAIIEGHTGEVFLPLDMFEKLDGVVMGHIHQHNILQNDPLVTYVGSMERKDFGEAGNPKYFLVVDYTNKKLVYRFEALPVRQLYDIDLDLSNTGESVNEIYMDSLYNFSKEHKMDGSIIRLNISINDGNIYNIDKNKIISYMKKELNIHHCVNIHTQIISKRQLRKSTITERINPIESFDQYLSLIEDEKMRKRMRSRGIKIINNRGNG